VNQVLGFRSWGLAIQLSFDGHSNLVRQVGGDFKECLDFLIFDF